MDRRNWLLAVLGAVIALLVFLVALGASPYPDITSGREAAAQSQAVKPPPPSPEPVLLVNVTPDDARTINAGIPYSKDTNPAARPFKYRAIDSDLARATDCLAAGVYYEAGDDAVGQRAVAQVVLNRLRHPAFPKSVCEVVFQGSERQTGCQFTFTCDDALKRYRPSAPAWKRAQKIAAQALHGAVFSQVGNATHYHTDWVVPYWSSSLDKITKVGTHLFFRWKGYWGTAAAFARAVGGEEPVVSALATLSAAHAPDGAAPILLADPKVLHDAAEAEADAIPPIASIANSPSVFLTHLPVAQAPRFPDLAQQSCAEMQNCRFMVWTDRSAVASALPLSERQLGTMSFSYVRDRSVGFERTLWNCFEFHGRTPCMVEERK